MKNCVKYINEKIVLWIIEEDNKVTDISFTDPNLNITDSSVLNCAMKEMDEYFKGHRRDFTFPISLAGTKFQVNTWNEMKKIKYGEVVTYKELTSRVTNKKAYRAVGSACNKNRLPIVIPCHRVVSSNGIGGYAGGLDIKKLLLKIEKASVHLN